MITDLKPPTRAFAVVLILLVLARWVTLTPAFVSVDDYVLLGLDSDPWANTLRAMFVPQGRFAAWFLLAGLTKLGVHPMHAQPLLAVLSIAATALAGVCVLGTWHVRLGPTALCAALALFCMHPYLAEMQTFRIGQLSYAFSLLGVAVGLYGASRRRIIAGACAVATGLAIYQVALSAAAVIIVFDLLTLLTGTERASTRRLLATPLALVLGVVLYIGVNAFVIRLTGATLSARGDYLALTELPSRLGAVVAHLGHMLFGDNALLTRALRLLLLALLMAGLCAAFVGAKAAHGARDAAVFVLAASAGLLASMLVVMPLRDFFAPPRVMAPISVFWAGCFAWTAHRAPRADYALSVVAALIVFGFLGKHQQVFSDQLRANQMDLMTSARIIARLDALPGAAAIRRVAIVGHPIRYRTTFTAVWDLNASGFFHSWAQATVLAEHAGGDWTLASAEEQQSARSYCERAAKWPAAEATTIAGELAVVCF